MCSSASLQRALRPTPLLCARIDHLRSRAPPAQDDDYGFELSAISHPGGPRRTKRTILIRHARSTWNEFLGQHKKAEWEEQERHRRGLRSSLVSMVRRSSDEPAEEVDRDGGDSASRHGFWQGVRGGVKHVVNAVSHAGTFMKHVDHQLSASGIAEARALRASIAAVRSLLKVGGGGLVNQSKLETHQRIPHSLFRVCRSSHSGSGTIRVGRQRIGVPHCFVRPPSVIRHARSEGWQRRYETDLLSQVKPRAFQASSVMLSMWTRQPPETHKTWLSSSTISAKYPPCVVAYHEIQHVGKFRGRQVERSLRAMFKQQRSTV